MRHRLGLLVIFTALSGACVSSTAPSPATIPAPNAVLSITVIGQPPQQSPTAIPGISPVEFDLRRSTGSALMYRIDFGDGTSAVTSRVVHTFEKPGMFAVVATVTDSVGRPSTVTRNVSVPDVFYAYWLSQEREVFFTRHDGRAVTGYYAVFGAKWKTFTGQIIPPAQVRFTTEDHASALSGSFILNDSFPMIGGGYYALDRRLKLKIAGGPENGREFELTYYDPY